MKLVEHGLNETICNRGSIFGWQFTNLLQFINSIFLLHQVFLMMIPWTEKRLLFLGGMFMAPKKLLYSKPEMIITKLFFIKNL